jgi:hypothetical protein
MVPADSDRIARVPSYLGNPLSSDWFSCTRLSRSLVRLSRTLPLTCRSPTADPLPHRHLHDVGLASSHFARHYFGNHSLFSLPQGTEMFHFPWFARATLWIQVAVTQLFAALGFPIRTSPDQRLVGNSPKLFAATHVLHRLLAPRHPPHALSSLLALISCLTPASRRIVETRDQGPGPCSSQQTRKTFICLILTASSCVGDFAFVSPGCLSAPGETHFEVGTSVENFTQQKLQLTLRMHLSKNVPATSRKLVELIGFEPTTSSLQSWRSPS